MASKAEQSASLAAPQGLVSEASGTSFDRDRDRFEVVQLEWPVTIDGRRYDQVTVHRMTVADVAAWTDKIRSGASAKFPMFDVPEDVIAQLDADDGDKLDEVAKRFLPRRFQAKTG